MRSKYIRISSEDKINSTMTNSRFSVDLNQTGGNVDNVLGYAVKYVSCANIFPNITDDNNVLVLTSVGGATIYAVPLPPAQYIINDFVNFLQVAINSIIPNSVAIIVDSFGKIVFTFTGDSYTLSSSQSTMANVLGLTEDVLCPDGVATTLPTYTNLQGETELYVHSKELNTAGLVEPNGAFSVVDVLPLDKPFGATCYSNYNDKELHRRDYAPYESKKSLRKIDIVLRNRFGKVLELPPNYEFNMIIIVYY